MTSEHVSTRVNSARLPEYVGKTVRLACKPLAKNADIVTVEASDGGQVTVQLLRDTTIQDPYIEVVGKVVDPTTIKMMSLINMGQDLDMKLVNDTIELIHDPRFYTRLFL